MQIKLLLLLLAMIFILLVLSLYIEKNIKKINKLLDKKLSSGAWSVLYVIVFVCYCGIIFAINLIALAMAHV